MPSKSSDCETFLSALRLIKGASGNKALRDQLHWNDGRYWKVHAALLTDELIAKGRGRGGSVRLV